MVTATRGCLIVFVAAACGGAPRRAPELPLGDEVVELVLPRPKGEGVDVDLATWRGHPAVVHFVVTGSLDGQSDVEELRRARVKRRDLQLAEVVLDETLGLAVPWANASAIDWTVLLPTAEVRAGRSPFGPIRVVPTTFVLDPHGRLVWRWEGAMPRGRLSAALDVLERAAAE